MSAHSLRVPYPDAAVLVARDKIRRTDFSPDNPHAGHRRLEPVALWAILGVLPFASEIGSERIPRDISATLNVSATTVRR